MSKVPFHREHSDNHSLIVEKNLQSMKDYMIEAGGGESVGCNAGSIEIDGQKHPCLCVNAHVNCETGEIIEFTNIGTTALSIGMMGFRMTMDNTIVDLHPSIHVSFSAEAMNVLEECMQEWNAGLKTKKWKEAPPNPPSFPSYWERVKKLFGS